MGGPDKVGWDVDVDVDVDQRDVQAICIDE